MFFRKQDDKRWLYKLLRLFCPTELIEEIEGDLEQKYNRDVSTVGKYRAMWRLLHSTVRFFRLGIIMRHRFSLKRKRSLMLFHFIKVFYRASARDKVYSLLNVSGLAISMVTSMFMLLWVLDELSYDNFHTNRERIFKVMSNHQFDESTDTVDDTPGPMGPALLSLPEVEESCRVIRFGVRPIFSFGNEQHYEEGMYADPSVLRIFNIPIIAGDARSPLAGMVDIVISQKLAEKYFHSQDPIGRSIKLDGNRDVRVTAVFENMPEHSTLKFDFILPFDVYAKQALYVDEWGGWAGGETFVKLHSLEQKAVVEQKIHESFTKPNIWVRWDDNVTMFLFPMTDWRLHGDFKDGIQVGGRVTYVSALAGAALFILLIACANFMNMTTARVLMRAKEIGVRKVVGAVRSSLVRQFMTEAMTMSFISVVVALIAAHLLTPLFNQLTGKALWIDYTNPWISGGCLAIAIFTGLIAGSYPAFVLSATAPVSALKKFTGAPSNHVRKVLVVFQFALSTILIVGALVVYNQIDYMKTLNLGFDTSRVFFMPYKEGISKNYDSFLESALSNTAIEDVTRSSSNPMRVFGGMVLSDNAWPGKTANDDVVFQVIRSDQRFVDAMKIEIVAGRNFSAALPGDTANYLINEEAARLMRLKDPVGATLIAPTHGEIVGVVKNFNTRELRDKMQPVIIAMKAEKEGVILVRYTTGQLEAALLAIDALQRQYEPGFPPEIQFMDDTFNELYKDEILIGRLVSIFTVIAIFVSCLGLFGLVSYAAQRRRKEIGIRKVLGAEIFNLVGLLCRDFVFLISIALLIGIPLALYGTDMFLDRFAYRTTPGITIIVISSVTLLAVSVLAVVFQSLKAATENPVTVLKAE
jgi:ABC-type antimicrobial peptide transport system permease subunit